MHDEKEARRHPTPVLPPAVDRNSSRMPSVLGGLCIANNCRIRFGEHRRAVIDNDLRPVACQQ